MTSLAVTMNGTSVISPVLRAEEAYIRVAIETRRIYVSAKVGDSNTEKENREQF